MEVTDDGSTYPSPCSDQPGVTETSLSGEADENSDAKMEDDCDDRPVKGDAFSTLASSECSGDNYSTTVAFETKSSDKTTEFRGVADNFEPSVEVSERATLTGEDRDSNHEKSERECLPTENEAEQIVVETEDLTAKQHMECDNVDLTESEELNSKIDESVSYQEIEGSKVSGVIDSSASGEDVEPECSTESESQTRGCEETSNIAIETEVSTTSAETAPLDSDIENNKSETLSHTNYQNTVEFKAEQCEFNEPSEIVESTENSSTQTDTVASKSNEGYAQDTTEGASSFSKENRNSLLDSVYYLKWFQWQGVQFPIVTQNENGPCPLLAIANVLLLSNKISIPPMQEFITAQQLMEYIGDYILSLTPKDARDEEFILNYEQNVQDAIAIMHKLQTGIDVNVKFTGCRDFEFTPECVVFDLLHIGLYHGWLVDPQDEIAVNAVGSLSYNQIVEKIIASKESTAGSALESEGVVAEHFLEQTASQLTYHGLYELISCLRPSELCVFFRNNHFSTLYKHNDKLYILVTDQGYLTEPRIVWETLSNVEGDGEFVNADFAVVGPIQAPYNSNHSTENTTGMSQEDRDFLVAWSLQDKNSDSSRSTPVWGMSPEELAKQEAIEQERMDHQLALRLQEQERQMASQQQRQHRTTDQRIPQPGQRYDATGIPSHRMRPSTEAHVGGDDDRQQGKCNIL